MDIIEQYNEMIKKLAKAEKWLDANSTRPDIMEYSEKYRISLDKANDLLKKVEKKLGRELTSKEILEGIETSWKINENESDIIHYKIRKEI